MGTTTDIKFAAKVVSDKQDPRPTDPQATQPLYETQVLEVTIYNAKAKDVTVNLRQYLGTAPLSSNRQQNSWLKMPQPASLPLPCLTTDRP